ncbi:MAG: TonB-dependent receptor [Ferruginibacter sp.]|nr:TonB-dependent receptor [Ferruginibacter sp.]
MSKRILLFTSLLLFALFSFAQTKVVKGKIVDETGNPVAGATVTEQGSKKGSQTDKNGNFSINYTGDGNVKLVISSIGFQSNTVTTGPTTSLTIPLIREINTQEEVVVIGYQSIKRKELTASVSAVGSKDLKDLPTNSAAEALAGKLAGVQVSVSEGSPGADVDIFVRGRNSITQSGAPLYIVDGIQVENALSVLSPQDIENVTVLKDAASTAIYGARGANGVFLITTKGGRNTGGKTTVTYNAFFGINKISRKLDMMDPYNFVLYAYERAKYTENPQDTAVVAQYIRLMSNYDTIAKAYQNHPEQIDWQDRILGRDAKQSTHNIAVSGGTAATQYNLSFTVNKQEGLLLNSDYDRKLASFRFDHKVSNKLKVGFNVRYNIQTIEGAGTSDIGGAGSNRLRQFTRYRPFILPGQTEDYYDADLDARNPGNGLRELNPFHVLSSEYRHRVTTAYNYNGYVSYALTKNISFRSTFGYDVNKTESKAFDDTLTSTSRSFNKLPLITLNNNDRYTINNSNVVTYVNNSLFKSKNGLNVLLGHEIYETVTKANALELRYFPIGIKPDAAFANIGLASAPAGFSQPKPISSEVTTRQVSAFTSIKYDYAKKYFLTVNFRADGSSLFGPNYASIVPLTDSTNRKWGYFPSVAAAWRISQEKFMSNLPFITDAKIRLSYGQSGNNRIGAYGYATGYTPPANGGYGLNDALTYTLVTPGRLGNPIITWETLESKNLGFDIELYKGRANLTADFYSNTTKDLLIENKFPATSGYTTQYQNVGSVRNNGIELQLAGAIIRKKDFEWNASLNISFNKNKILNLGSNTSFTANSGWFSTANSDDYILQVGQAVGTMYGLQVEGFYTTDDFTTTPYSNPLYPNLTTQYTLKTGLANPASVLADLVAPGQIKYRDVNGDGKITLDGDRTVIGNALPKYTGGFNQNFAFKGFDLSIFTNFSVGGDIYNANKLEYSSAYGNDANLLAEMTGRWKVIDQSGNLVQKQINATTTVGVAPDQLKAINAGATIWQPIRTTTAFYPMSYAIEDGSYLRLNNITLGYTLPTFVVKKAHISSLRLYATVSNVATITGYSGYDPDVNAKRSNPLTPGVDYSAYPRGRTYLVGLNLSL